MTTLVADMIPPKKKKKSKECQLTLPEKVPSKFNKSCFLAVMPCADTRNTPLLNTTLISLDTAVAGTFAIM